MIYEEADEQMSQGPNIIYYRLTLISIRVHDTVWTL